MTFEITRNVKIKRDNNGVVRQIYHPRQAYTVETFASARALEADSLRGRLTPREMADQYIREVLPVYQLTSDMADNLTAEVPGEVVEEGPKLKVAEEKIVRDQATVSYTQTYLGLPVWEAGLAVRIRNYPLSVTSSHSSVHTDIEVDPPAPDAAYMPERIDAEVLAKCLGLEENQPRPVINSKQLLIYQDDAKNRGNGWGEPEENDETQMHVSAPKLNPPPVPNTIESGRHYVVVEVLFTLTIADQNSLNWRAFIEPNTGAVLYLSVFVGCLHGHVYLQDALTKTGNTSIRPSSSDAVLDALRDRVPLLGLQPPPQLGIPQKLEGEFCKIIDIDFPNATPPEETPPDDFSYSVRTNEFAAVNAYYHCDRLFRMMEEMGFDVRAYFDGTNFPVRVDHRSNFGRGSGNVVNAQAPGNTFGNGSDGFRFALIEANSEVCIAVDWRVVLHEFGHTLLWDNVNSPNFRFSHSAGDTLAAILNDPDSKAPDRGLTFPWTPIRRRHDHLPSSGFAWGGGRDVGGYESEQILSSTLFRLYRAMGGDHENLEERRFAARYIAFLIFQSIGTLSRFAQPNDAEEYADILMESDLENSDFEGQPGGAIHKVIRWAFEQQGLYQPPGAPRTVTTPGAPPEVDVYIDDGRDGTYEPLRSFPMGTRDIWVRRNADGGMAHENPVSRTINFIYVKVKNRGTLKAENVTVSAFVSRDRGDQMWPSAWNRLQPIGLSEDSPLDTDEEIIIGPFRWLPEADGEYSLLLSVNAEGDLSNADTVNGPIPAQRLVHCDNNIAVREVTVVPV